MTLVRNSFGKGRVRLMRVHRGPDRHEVRETNVKLMVEGDFARAYEAADNTSCMATDTIKNLVYVVGRDAIDADSETFAQRLCDKYLSLYPQIATVTATLHETRWNRLSVGGEPHPHSFLLDGNGKSVVRVVADRSGKRVASGVDGFTFLKSTQSGWVDFYREQYTTLADTDDRICSTAMEAMWHWATAPADYPAANATVLETMMAVFATTYSHSVQDSLYRMGEAALAAVPEIARIDLACPNKHYIPFDLSRFDLPNENAIFVATDEPHGQIECSVARG